MNSPKKNMRIVRKTFRHERKGAKKTYSYQKANNQHIIKVRLQHAKQLFSKNPEQLTRVNQELKNKRDSDLQTFRADKKKSLEESKAAYIEQVNTAPLQALTASELKKYRLPRMKDEYRSSKGRFKASQKEYRQARRKEIIDLVFSYGQKNKEETNFSRRQSNFQPYESKKNRVKVQVQLSQKERVKNIFGEKHFSFRKKIHQTAVVDSGIETNTRRNKTKSGRFWYESEKQSQQQKQLSSSSNQQYVRFKRVVKENKQHSQSGRFRYSSPETKEKKATRDKFKADYKSRKADFKKGKRAYHFKRPRTKVNLVSRFIIREAADLLAEDDDLRSIRDIQQVTRKTVNYSKFTYRGGKATVKATRGTYRFGKNRITNLRERTANFRAGRGFRLNDPKRHVNQRIKRYIQRMKQNLVNSFKNTVNFIKSIPQIIQAFIANPINWLIAGGVLLLILMFSAFMSVSSRVLIQQDEFELTKAYQHMTWEDSENSIKSTNGATYYTKIDDVMTYMNYRFQDYRLSDRTSESISSQDQELNSTTGFTSSSSTTGQNETYKQYLSQLWKDLNGGDSIKSMASLYKENGKYGLTKEQIEELDEYKESGAYLGLYELDNPFQGQTVDDVLTMTYRYGYYNTDGKSAMSYHIILEAKQGQVIVAPMDGYIKLDGDDVLIVSSEGKIVEARLRMKDIATGRVQEGQKIYTGEIIGETKSDQGLKLYYQKYNDDKEKLVYVNPAFYFPNVVQVQTTILPSIGQFQGDEVGRAKQVYDFLKAKGASNQFIAAVLGNWSVESSVTSKRAEGDYLSPPVGATDTSWDDDAWLSIGGPAIYNGRYPNIIHRGLGLGQWTDTADGSVRHTLLRNYATSKGKKWYDLDLQLEFMMEGDSPYYTNWVKKHMTDTGSPATLAQLFLIYWEGNAGDKLLERQSRAIEWFYQIEKGFSQAAAGTAKVDVKSLESIRGDLYDGIVPGGGDDMGYPWGQCTWGTAKRMNQLGLQLKGRDGSKIPIISTMGNGMDWVATASRLGGETGTTPRDGAIISFNLGDTYGHVALVEKVYPDGSFLISETNYNGSAYNPTGVVTFRTISGADASMNFAYTQK
ncbi:phage tail tip lysozyme [Streptococcus suis]|uniref:Phage tail tip lysozyme n=1 Tax=Streptococcus suis TaxID=1307 RepID=A0AAW9DIK8_STRSU|nr:phage tail tip lysozyme [Streptococcus suis]MDX5038024.1 phage tail tip lysozyme [Streptococcus suis]